MLAVTATYTQSKNSLALQKFNKHFAVSPIDKRIRRRAPYNLKKIPLSTKMFRKALNTRYPNYHPRLYCSISRQLPRHRLTKKSYIPHYYYPLRHISIYKLPKPDKSAQIDREREKKSKRAIALVVDVSSSAALSSDKPENDRSSRR